MFTETSNISIWKTFVVLEIFVDVLLEKTAHAQLGYHTRKSRKT